MFKPCAGCQACSSRQIPDFESDEEEESFWDSHHPDQFELHPVKVRLRGRPRVETPKQRVTLMLHPNLKRDLVSLAEKRGMKYQTLIQSFLCERVGEELKRLNP
jgi:predicted DNA binding CopG/RHH family protein